MNIGYKFKVFVELFFEQGGWKRVITEGLRNTLLIAVIGLLIGIVIGTLIAVIRVMPKYKKLPRFLDRACTVYVGFFRGTPIVVQLLIAYYVLFPIMGLNIPSLLTCILVFGFNSGAYVSEVMRGGINSVDRGQLEAGRAVGLSFAATMLKIVVPQAVKNILPTLGNEFIVLIKDTSIVSFIAVVDLTKAFRMIGDANYEYVIPYLFLAAVYLVIVFAITMGIRAMERRLKKSER